MNWTPTRDKEKYGVVIYNFSGNNDSCIKLNVGDTVHIMEELGDWYFGYALLNKALRGIFPKSFIHIKECHVNKTRLVEEVTARSPPVTQEVTSVLREWGVLLKKLYVEDSDNFVLLRDTMIELIAFRNKILSGKQTVDELKQLKRRITFGIDRINVKLGLDLVVRDDQGNIINPAITSAVRLYRYHDEAVTQLQKNSESSGNSHSLRQKPHLSWTALITIKNIVIKVPEPSEISLGLFVGDASLGKEKPLSEAFVIPWTDSMYSGHTDLLLNLKCLFTDLRTSTLDESPVWLIGSVVRQGSMVTKEVDTKRTSSAPGKKDVSTDFMRRPFGVVIFDMTAIIKNQKQNVLDGYESKETEYLASFYQCGEKETLDMKKLLSARNENVRDNKIGTHGIWFTLELINGDLKQVRDDNPRYVSLRDVPVALHLGLSDVIMPGDVRNDLYITVLSGEFARGAKPSDRNVEVTVRVFNEKGFLIPGVIHQGCGKEPLNEYRSVTYYHENKPKWMETIKIALPIEEFKKSHVKFTFKHRSTNDVKDKNEKPFAMSFVKLMQDNGTTLNNTEHELIVYKIDSKKWHDNDTDYLKLNWRRHNAEEIVKTWQFGLAPSAKENFLISTTFCSTKLTQNEKLLGLLEWGWSGSKDSSALRTHLDRLRNVNSDELMVFLQDTLDVLFEILMNNSTDEDSDNQFM
ncbi:Dedicator of cytokinesis protein 2 [Halocaridina rubra]|uniref:Dedicator of cytokinesis protein 2 n=1 Tax=Halocaridina rubra TaxID=373956 RepID=A0AAN9ABJ8_HALRR